jgi:leucyl-tRNA synthetase
MGPLTASLPWTDEGLNGMRKWLDRVYRLFTNPKINYTSAVNEVLDRAYHKFVKQVSININERSFNVAISQMMIYINECYNHTSLSRQHMEIFLIIFSCFAPHLAEELWNQIFHHNTSVTLQVWPSYDPNKTVDEVITLPIQENGKLRTTISIKLNEAQDKVEQQAYNDPKVIKFLNGRKPKKIIYVKNKILNFIL